jgi:membrane dipeptidase
MLAVLSFQVMSPDSALLTRARAIHARALTLDTHDDIDPANFTGATNYTARLKTQVNLPKMVEGGLDAAFFIVFVGQAQDFTRAGFARAHAAMMAKFAAIHRLTDTIAPGQITLALTAADVRRIHAAGTKVALIGVENAYPFGPDLEELPRAYQLGTRYVALVHNGHNQFADSHTGERDGKWRHHGLSRLGRQAVAELNRLGIMVDVSHGSKAAMLQTVAWSKAPVIASHSGVRALANHSRNLDDEQLVALARKGGVAQLVAFRNYVRARDSTDRRPVTVADFVNHIDYAVKLVGIDHVGISSDFDGGGGVDGWNDASETFNVTLELVRRGYSEADIDQLWSGNLLRVMERAEAVARALRAGSRR